LPRRAIEAELPKLRSQAELGNDKEHTMNTMVITHGLYILLGIVATVWVVRALRHSGLAFLIHWCGGDEQLAASWNHLLAVGIYLLHVGCLLLALRIGGQVSGQIEVIELLSTKIGFVLLALAVTHFIHIRAYWEMYGRTAKHLPAAEPRPIDAVIVPEIVNR
jgi:hypothetical protein